MSKSRNLVLFVFLIIGLSLLTVIPLTNAFSETFHLKEGYVFPDKSIERTVELNHGDRIVGDFTFSNIPVWNSFGSNMTYTHHFTIYDPKGNTVLRYTNNNHASFDQTASYPGVYKFQFFLSQPSQLRPLEEIANAQATLNYNIVQPNLTPTQRIESIFFSSEFVLIIVLLLVSVCIIAGAFYFYRTEKGNSKPQKEYSEQNQTKLSSSKIMCGSCSTINDIDAVYCKNCARQLR